ncbi:MAG: AAA family ATPase [Candidatus Binatia bacterium]
MGFRRPSRSVQYAPALLNFVKEKIDSDRRPGRWLLTGSQSFPLMHGISQSLAGRVAVVAARIQPCNH